MTDTVDASPGDAAAPTPPAPAPAPPPPAPSQPAPPPPQPLQQPPAPSGTSASPPPTTTSALPSPSPQSPSATATPTRAGALFTAPLIPATTITQSTKTLLQLSEENYNILRTRCRNFAKSINVRYERDCSKEQYAQYREVAASSDALSEEIREKLRLENKDAWPQEHRALKTFLQLALQSLREIEGRKEARKRRHDDDDHASHSEAGDTNPAMSTTTEQADIDAMNTPAAESIAAGSVRDDAGDDTAASERSQSTRAVTEERLTTHPEDGGVKPEAPMLSASLQVSQPPPSKRPKPSDPTATPTPAGKSRVSWAAINTPSTIGLQHSAKYGLPVSTPRPIAPAPTQQIPLPHVPGQQHHFTPLIPRPLPQPHHQHHHTFHQSPLPIPTPRHLPPRQKIKIDQVVLPLGPMTPVKEKNIVINRQLSLLQKEFPPYLGPQGRIRLQQELVDIAEEVWAKWRGETVPESVGVGLEEVRRLARETRPREENRVGGVNGVAVNGRTGEEDGDGDVDMDADHHHHDDGDGDEDADADVDADGDAEEDGDADAEPEEVDIEVDDEEVQRDAQVLLDSFLFEHEKPILGSRLGAQTQTQPSSQTPAKDTPTTTTAEEKAQEQQQQQQLPKESETPNVDDMGDVEMADDVDAPQEDTSLTTAAPAVEKQTPEKEKKEKETIGEKAEGETTQEHDQEHDQEPQSAVSPTNTTAIPGIGAGAEKQESSTPQPQSPVPETTEPAAAQQVASDTPTPAQAEKAENPETTDGSKAPEAYLSAGEQFAKPEKPVKEGAATEKQEGGVQTTAKAKDLVPQGMPPEMVLEMVRRFYRAVVEAVEVD
ncbi:hypothetical protein EX30DRAFT_374845 [Ascodesmis nigricans]|uniref:Uncharacterized protein n=1 Tax=Ascodesmis nigricans TaxID=341454 RepID=A0A4S2MR28_9PEZI|nr:hypothetical protein EX30DRAFT_374845 [Ascodesmis nigricans]